MKTRKDCEGCCADDLTTRRNDRTENYTSALSRGGLAFPSHNLSEYVAWSFALLDASSSLIRESNVSERRAGEELLNVLERPQVLCDVHQNSFQRKADRIITNIFFKNARKRKTETLLKDKVAALKKVKRDK